MNLLRMPRVFSVLSVKAMVTLLHNLSRRFLIRRTDSDDEGLETVVYEPVGSESDTDEDVRVFSV